MNFDFRRLTSRKKIVVVLALLTGILHFLYGLTSTYGTSEASIMDYLFMANLFGNIFFISLLYFTPELDDYNGYIRLGFILYTLTSIIAYFYQFGGISIAPLLLPSGVFDKLLEVMLIVFLILDRPLEKNTQKNTDNASPA